MSQDRRVSIATGGVVDPHLLATLQDVLDSPMPAAFVGEAEAILDNSRKREQLSLAVLPFRNLSAGGDDYFAEGIAEDILTELARFRTLFVIARNSSFSFKDTNLDLQEISRRLSVDYLVTGSVRRFGNRARVAAQLIFAPSSQEIWSERYDREVEDIFRVQDEVVRTIVVTLESRLGVAVASRLESRPRPSLAAYECALLARKHLYLHDFLSAMPYIEQAIQLDPGYGYAYALLGYALFTKNLEDPSPETVDQMHSAATTALRLDETDSRAHAILSMTYLFRKQHDLASQALMRALKLNPADSLAAAGYADLLLHSGDAVGALAAIDDLFLRDPFPPPGHWDIRATALLLLGRYEEAIASMSRVPKKFWYIHGALAICHARLGQHEHARDEIKTLLELRPEITPTGFIELSEFRRKEDQDFIMDGLRAAGLPD